MYRVAILADNTHTGLQLQFNTWLREEKPARIHQVNLVSNGSEFTYSVLILYTASDQRAKDITEPGAVED